jgi:hypothetical protein
VNTVCVLITTSILLFPGCLLRNDGTSDLTKDGIRIAVAVTPDSLPVDSVLTVTLTVENTSAETGIWHYRVYHAGSTWVVGCFPENNGATVPSVCASRQVTLKTK